MANKPKEWRVCKHLYEKYLSNPETFYTADEISRNIRTCGGNCCCKRKTYHLTSQQIGRMFGSNKIYEYAEFDIRDTITEGRYCRAVVHEYRFKKGLIKEFQS